MAVQRACHLVECLAVSLLDNVASHVFWKVEQHKQDALVKKTSDFSCVLSEFLRVDDLALANDEEEPREVFNFLLAGDFESAVPNSETVPDAHELVIEVHDKAYLVVDVHASVLN